jgi:molybdopterin-synthase adenylyltransferase
VEKTLSMAADMYQGLMVHLFATEEEQAAFLFCASEQEEAIFRVRRIRLLEPNDLEDQSRHGISLTDSTRAELIKQAWAENACLVEVHSHNHPGPVAFSPFDLDKLDEWVPHLWWRLRGRPYIALVAGPDSFDALVWSQSADQPESLAGLEVDGQRHRSPTNRTIRRLNRYSRHLRLFGKEGQKRISRRRVAIVGLGGLGSHVAQQLAHLGVQRYVLVDDDVVTDSSLNRLIGATESDAVANVPKVAVAERLIKQILPEAMVASTEHPVDADPFREVLTGVDLVFGCVDTDVPRLQLTEYCARRGLPYIDLATDITEAGEYGGRVMFARDGNGCLSCMGEIDQHALARSQMTPEQRDADDRIYGIEHGALGGTGPSVVSLNGVIASLAVTEFMVYVIQLREPKRMLVYRADQGGVRISMTEPAPGCYFCQTIWGTG